MSDTELLPSRVDPGARRDRRRRKSLRRRAAGWAAVGVPLIVILVVLLTQIGGKPASAPRAVGNAAEGGQVTYLFVGTRTGDDSGQADWLTLMAIDRSGRHPLTVFIPTGTLTEIPGYGYDIAGKALALGQVELQQITVENMLGIHIDHTMIVPDTLLSRLIDRAGGVTISLRSALMRQQGANRVVPLFQPGTRRFNGATTVRFLQYIGPDEDELARLDREQQVLEALFTRYGGANTDKLERIVSGFGNQLITDASPSAVGAFFAAFASAGPDLRTYRALPVAAVGTGEEAAFRIDQPRFDGELARLLAPSRPSGVTGTPIRVQILNGNGQPEIGVAVARVLIAAGYRIADTGNASSFGFRRTRIVAYSDADLAAARRIRILLGVGSIEIGRTPQTIVDVTVVVGADFTAPGQ